MSDTAAVRGVIVPLAILFVAVVLWIRTSFDQSLGPLDFDAATRLVVALWASAPIVGGGLTADLPPRTVARAGTALGIVVGLVTAAVIAFGPRPAVPTTVCGALGSLPPFWIGAIAVGALVGFGMAIAEVAMATLTRRGWWLLGAPLTAGINFAASAAAAEVLYSRVVCM
jgi:hypothetical protein